MSPSQKDLDILYYLLKNKSIIQKDVNWRFPKKFEHYPKEVESELLELLKTYKSPILARYGAIEYVSNISLSVHPEIKKRWGINFELFGNPYNTQYNYCSMFPDEDKRVFRGCNAFDYKPHKDDVILANPPYTVQHIVKTIEMIEEWFRTIKYSFDVWLVIPVWDVKEREKLGLKLYGDIEAIDKIKKNRAIISVRKYYGFRFYDFFSDKESILTKTPIYVIHLAN